MTADVAEERDWVGSLHGPFREAFCDSIRALSLARLQKYPTPKNAGLPFGQEARVLQRFLSGRSSLLDPSGLSRAYLSLASSRDRLLYRAFILGQALPRAWWLDAIGSDAVAGWLDRSLLLTTPEGNLCCRFRVIAVGDVTVVADHENPSLPNRVHIGQDSLNLLEFLLREAPTEAGRFLDVGTGSGLILLAMARGRDEALGIDINPRAVTLARVNAALNRSRGCRVEEKNALGLGSSEGAFDLVTWNAPFMFLPEGERDRHVDGYGGHLGIALTLDFVERLPNLLGANGVAYILTSAPVLQTGENKLETEIAARAERLNLDVVAHVLQAFWNPALREFHRRHAIRHFESVILKISLGGGRVRRIAPPMSRRAVDAARSWLYGALGSAKP